MGERAGHLEGEIAVPSSARAASWVLWVRQGCSPLGLFPLSPGKFLFSFPFLIRGFAGKTNAVCRGWGRLVSSVDLFRGKLV